MRKKIRILIVISILGLLALSVIQGYLINNTYRLKREAFISETRRSISRLDDFSPKLDSINDIWQGYFLNVLAGYRKGNIEKSTILKRLKLKTDSLNDAYIKNFNIELSKKERAYDLKFQKRIKTIIFLDSIKSDTIYSKPNAPTFYFLGNAFKEEEAHRVSNSLWLTDHSYDEEIDGETVESSFDLHFETLDYMNIDGWKKIVFNRMKGLLLVSVLIFLLVFGLLYYSIKNLITQKKIADVKTDFVNNITHELKTPLATLTLATKMLKKDTIVTTESEIANTTVNTIERQNKRLQKLIDQVLNNSLGYNEIQLHKEPINTADYLHTILNDFELSVHDENIILNKNIHTDEKKVSVDKFYFTTALFNILENAVKYGNDNVTIDSISKIEHVFSISITDNGIGIPTKDQKQLFDKFFRVGNKEIHNVKGLGLGLYYTNQIVKAHKGTIEVKSAENKGTTFIIKIPLT